MEIGWQRQRRRREPTSGQEGQPWGKAKLRRGRGKDTGAGRGHPTVSTDGGEVLPRR